MAVERIDLTSVVLDIHRDLSVTARQQPPGPPHRIDGVTVGLAAIEPGQSPHDGERHPDGDEILYVVRGRMLLTYDSGEQPLVLTAGEACVVRKGEWHKVDCTESTEVLYLTPGPNGDARFNAP